MPRSRMDGLLELSPRAIEFAQRFSELPKPAQRRLQKLLHYLAADDPHTRRLIDRLERGEVSIEAFNKVVDELPDFGLEAPSDLQSERKDRPARTPSGRKRRKEKQ